MGKWIEARNEKEREDEEKEKEKEKEKELALAQLWKAILEDDKFVPLHGAMMDAIQSDDPDRLVLRFLRARKFNIHAAKDMLQRCLVWYNDFGVKNISEKDLPPSESESGKFYFHKTCKQGQVISIVHVRLHEKDAEDLEKVKRWCVFQMETGRRLLTPPIEKVTLIFDMTGFSMKNMDFNFVYFLIHCFEAYYPESLGLCLVVGAPWIFWGCWKIISPVLDPVVKSKIHFVNADKLTDYIDKENLVEVLGGSDKYKYKYIPPADRPPVDEKLKAELSEKMKKLYDQYLENTKWLAENFSHEAAPEQLQKIEEKLKERRELREALRENFFEQSPLREETVYHRLGVIRDNGRTIDWSVVDEK